MHTLANRAPLLRTATTRAVVPLARGRVPGSFALTTVAKVESAGYLTISAKHSAQTEVKKSKFVAVGWPISSTQQALGFIAEASDPSASHNCFAYKFGDEVRWYDDGEPGGTAGRPILSCIEGAGLDAVCVLVTRYFGGVKLGAGGLVRAYAKAAKEVLRQAPKHLITPKATVAITAPFQQIGSLYQIAEQYAAERLSEEFLESGDVTLTLRVNQSAVHDVTSSLLNATSGQITTQVIDRA